MTEVASNLYLVRLAMMMSAVRDNLKSYLQQHFTLLMRVKPPASQHRAGGRGEQALDFRLSLLRLGPTHASHV